MFLIKKARNSVQAIRKNSVKTKLRAFLDKNEPELVQFLQRFWKEQENAISYADLREAILDGEINEEWVHQWQQDYSQFVTEHLQPLWISAMQEAAQRQKEKSSGWNFDIAAESVHHWTFQRGAAFVTNCTNTQKNALQAVISRTANTDQNVDQLARLVRPMIGLTRLQSVANANYAQTLRSKRLPPKRVAELSMQYAARQHRYRAQVIARTELAFAFNQGTIEWARQAQASGYLGKAVKVWSSARDKRSCSVCKNLHGTEVLLDEPFPFETKLSDPDARLAPPAHPHCRCAIDIREIEPSRFDYIEEIETPKPLPESERYDIIEEINGQPLLSAFEMQEYRTSDGEFDLDRAKKDYETFLQTVPERNQNALKTAFETATFEQRVLKRSAFGYLDTTDTIYYDPSKEEFWDYNWSIVLTHELGHRIDCTMFIDSAENIDFSAAIKDAKAVLDVDHEMFLAFAENDSMGFLSDILSAVCEDDYRFPAYHEKPYWLEDGNKEKEIFANLFSLEVLQDEKSLDFFKKNFTNIWEEYQNFISLLTKGC